MAYKDNTQIFKKINSIVVDWGKLEMDFNELSLKIMFESYGSILDIIVIKE
jgi:hypothetical protein